VIHKEKETMFAIGGNCVVKRIRLNNLVVGNIGAAGSLNVDVAVSAALGLTVDSVGIAIPVDADLTAGLLPPIARATSTTNLRLRFVNPSAGAIDPADTFDWDVFMFQPTGMVDATV
jgi:hypothetical protein